MCAWTFKPKSAGDSIREPIHGEFFATDAISDPGTALIREGIQNSLDAAVGGEPVTVRVFLSGSDRAAPASEVHRYFEDARPHLDAAGNGLHRDQLPDWEAACPFVLFEDFGTEGLSGDPSEPFRSRTEQKNHFYHFFRAEGQTDKGSSKRGSWGVGKHVFWRSSRISSVLAYTVRASDAERLLMGKAVLKCHYVGDDYCQDGYFGSRPRRGSELVLPIANEEAIENFRETFRLRRSTEPGLSVVVPWPDIDISHASLLRSVVRDYFHPILSGTLRVLVETPDVSTSLERDTLLAEVRRLGPEIDEELTPLLELAQWSRTVEAGERVELFTPDPSRAWAWDKSLFPEPHLPKLQARFEELRRIAVRVPVTVRKKNEPPRPSFFDVFVVRDPSGTAERPTFVREGVIVAKVDAPRSRGVRALVIADDEPLGSFLRDAENPSHTEWQHDGSNFRGKYRSGRTDLRFVKRSVKEIVRILTETEAKEDRTLLADFFSLPAEGVVRGRTEEPTTESGPSPPTPSMDAVPASTQRPAFRVQQIRGGFAILPGDHDLRPPLILDVRTAYDVRRGNPLKRYRTSDFRLEAAPIRFDPPPKNLEVIRYRDNHLVVEILDGEFSLHVAGFDPHRDLYVKIEPQEEPAVGSAL